MNRLHKFMGEPIETSQKRPTETNDTPNGPQRTPIETSVTIPVDEYVRLKVAAERVKDLEDWKLQAQRLLISSPPKRRRSFWQWLTGQQPAQDNQEPQVKAQGGNG